MIKKYYPFWLGLIICIGIIGLTKDFPSFGTLLTFLLGYFKLTKLHNDN